MRIANESICVIEPLQRKGVFLKIKNKKDKSCLFSRNAANIIGTMNNKMLKLKEEGPSPHMYEYVSQTAVN